MKVKYANHKNYTQGFLVNVTLENPPWGKPVEEEIYYGARREILQQINEHKEPDLQQPKDLKLGRKFLLEVHAVLGISTLLLCFPLP